MSHSVDECYSVYDERHRRARKPHVCEACGESISRGQTYWSIHIVFDGSAQTVKRCERCQAIHKHLRTVDRWGDTWPAERLDCGEEYRSHWGVDPPPEIAALAFALPGEVQR